MSAGLWHGESICLGYKQEMWNPVETHKHTLSHKLATHLALFFSLARRSFYLTRGRVIAPSGVQCLVIAICLCVSMFKWLITNKAWYKTWCGEEYLNFFCFILAIRLISVGLVGIGLIFFSNVRDICSSIQYPWHFIYLFIYFELKDLLKALEL